MRVLIAVLTMLIAPCVWAEMIVDNDFEGAFSEAGLGEGWAADSYSNWGTYDVSYARDAQAHTGESAQSFTIHRMGYISPERKTWIGLGAAQIAATTPVPLEVGQVYRVTAYLKGDVPTARVFLRQSGAPWAPYVERSVVLSDEWQRCEFLWTSTVDDPGAPFMVSFAHLGAVSIDDMRVERLDDEQVAALTPPTPEGNLLRNPSFDLGTSSWLGQAAWENVADPVWTIIEDAGNRRLQVELPEGMAISVGSDVVEVAPNHPISIGCRAKATPGTHAIFGAYTQGSNHALPAFCVTEAELSSEWTELGASGRVGFSPDDPQAFLRLVISGPTVLTLDDVFLRQDEGQIAARAEVAIMPARSPGGLYFSPETPVLRILGAVPTGFGPVEAAWRIVNVPGDTVLSGEARLAEGVSEREIACDGLARGWFRAEVEWPGGQHESTFCLLPPLERRGDAATSPFGAHFQIGPAHTDLADAVGARWIRLWPPSLTLFATVEPERGQRVWRDAEVQALCDKGFEIVGMLESPPEWAGDPYTGNSDEWDAYVADVVAHYADTISWWEVRNEPDLKWWMSKPEGPSRAEQYFECLRRTYGVVKGANPAAVVIGGCMAAASGEGTDGVLFTRELIDLGALDYMDVLSYHYYHSYTDAAPLDELPEPIEVSMDLLRERMRAAGRELPIINTEGGVFSPASALSYRPTTPDNTSPMSPAMVARLLARMYVSQVAAGVDRFFYYNFFMGGSPYAKAWDSFIEGDGQPRPAIAAYATLTWALDGRRYASTERPSVDTWIHRFSGPEGDVLACWSRTGAEGVVSIPDATRAVDFVGADIEIPADGALRLTADPIYVWVE